MRRNGLDILGYDLSDFQRDWASAYYQYVRPTAQQIPVASSFVPLADVVHQFATPDQAQQQAQYAAQAAQTATAAQQAKQGISQVSPKAAAMLTPKYTPAKTPEPPPAKSFLDTLPAKLLAVPWWGWASGLGALVLISRPQR